MVKNLNRYVIFGEKKITINDIFEIAHENKMATLTKNTKYLKRIANSANFLANQLNNNSEIYGVNTGYGESCIIKIPNHLVKELPSHLTKFHGCGLGRNFSSLQGRAILATRLASLSIGASGVRKKLLEAIILLLNKDFIPVIPSEGSVGASGDLTPLSYLAAVLMGERKVYVNNSIKSTKSIFKTHNIKPLQFLPKEALAIMNGTAVMTALAVICYKKAETISQLATRITAMNVFAANGNVYHFDKDLFDLKPHIGQQLVAKRIREDLKDLSSSADNILQDRYSLRCAPHVIGVLEDTLIWSKLWIESEINSANDNPLIDGEKEKIMHGGHFYGGHIAQAMDSLKITIANVADLLDRQMALMMDPNANRGLPRNLSGASENRKHINHGLKAVQIAVSAFTAEALRNTTAASIFSRSTENHNQDKVSMGTIAARDCLRILELTEQVVAALLITAHQGCLLRIKMNVSKKIKTPKSVIKFLDELKFIPFISEDKPLEDNLIQLVEKIQNRKLIAYEATHEKKTV